MHIPSLDLIAITCTEDMVISMICKLDSEKTTSCDKLLIRFIKTYSEAMGKLLTVLVNKNIFTG